MDNSTFAAYITGCFAICAAIIGPEISYAFLVLQEYFKRKNNRNQLLFELLALSSSLKAMKEAAQAEVKIENPNELAQVAIVLKRYDTQQMLTKLKKLMAKSIIFSLEHDIAMPKLFAEFRGMILQIVVLIERIDDLNKINNFPNQKELLVCKLDAILEKIEKINNKILAIKFYNE